MQKGQSGARLSTDENRSSGYAQGFQAGFEAGRRASHGEGAQQNITRTNGQPLTVGKVNQKSQLQDKKGSIHTRQVGIKSFQQRPSLDKKPANNGHLSNGFQSRKSFDQPTITRDVAIHNQEHKINGQITNPETGVKFNARGH